MEDRRKVRVQRIDAGSPEWVDDVVAVEEPLTIYVSGEELVTLLYTPPMARELALGYLRSEGYIAGMGDVENTSGTDGGVDVVLRAAGTPARRGRTRVISSGCGGGVTFTNPACLKQLKTLGKGRTISSGEVYTACSAFRKGSELFEATGGVHSAALFDGAGMQAFAEDIGRHNAVDKVFGACMLGDIETAGKMLLTTGRVSSEILVKCVKMAVPVIVSRGAPTSLAVELAERFNVTLIGFARGRRMNVYTQEQRINV